MPQQWVVAATSFQYKNVDCLEFGTVCLPVELAKS
jgi:hypothetical protein